MYVPAWPGLNPWLGLQAPAEKDPPYPLNAPAQVSTYVARHAIYRLFKALDFGRGGDTVLVPDYHHGNEVRAIRAAGAAVRFYRVTRDMQPDLDDVARLCWTRPRALFVIHYLGWPQPMPALTALCRAYGMLLIEDCALALLSAPQGRPLGSYGEYAVFCLYKTLPVPNGGLLIQNRKVLPDLASPPRTSCGLPSVSARLAELTFRWADHRSPRLGAVLRRVKRAAGRTLSAMRVARLPVGDTGFDMSQADLAMSPICRRLLARFDYRAIRERRRGNYVLLSEQLADMTKAKPLEPGICPLFFPILVPDKAAAAVELQRRGVESVEFWNVGDPEAKGARHADAQFLRDHVLELPIHQDLRPDQVEYMADQVRRYVRLLHA